MSDPATNGGWPEGLSADVQELPNRFDEHSSLLELAQAYASIALAYGHEHPKIVQALEFLRDAGHDMAIQLGRLAADVKRLADSRTSSIPPMRPPLDSSSHIIEQAKHETEMLVKEEARRTPGPLVDPDAATRIAADVFAKKMAERESEIKARADADRLAALEQAEIDRKAAVADAQKQRKDDAHKLKMKFLGALVAAIAAGIVGTVSALATVGASAVKAREQGHAEGIAEIRSVITTQTQHASSSVAPAPVAPAAAASPR